VSWANEPSLRWVLGPRAIDPNLQEVRFLGQRAKSPRGPFLGPTSQVSDVLSGPVYKGLVSWANEPSPQEVLVSWAIEPRLQGVLVSWAIGPLRPAPHPHPTPPNQHHPTPPHLAPRLCRCIRCHYRFTAAWLEGTVLPSLRRRSHVALEVWMRQSGLSKSVTASTGIVA
jgi:hypothetical protein